MAPVDHRLLRWIDEIAEALSGSERRALLYLCGNLHADSSVSRVKETLRSEAESRNDANHFLAEVIWRLDRYDILKHLFTWSRNEAQQTLGSCQVLPKFRVLMVNLSENMCTEDVKRVVFLLGETLPREMRTAQGFLEVIIELEKLDLVSPEKVDFLEECLRNISRVDLAKKITEYRLSAQSFDRQSSQQQFNQTRISQEQPGHIARASSNMPVYRRQSCENPLGQYKLSSLPRGLCVIIDCVGKDEGILKQIFQALHFNMALYPMLTSSEILPQLTKVAQSQNLQGDAFVCCIISRGTADQLLGIDPSGSGVSFEQVRKCFTGNNCPALAGKPKLFFIQSYNIQEERPGSMMGCYANCIEVDGCDGTSAGSCIPTEADIFWSHCFTDERQLEQKDHNSVYLTALAGALHNAQKRKTLLVDAHMEVNGSIYTHNSISPETPYHIIVKHTLRKNLCLI